MEKGDGVLRGGEKNVSKRNLFSGKRGAFHSPLAPLWAKELLAICREAILGSPIPYFSCSKSFPLYKLCHALGYSSHGRGCVFLQWRKRRPAVSIVQEVLKHEGSPAMSLDCSPAGEKPPVSPPGWTRPFHNSTYSKRQRVEEKVCVGGGG